MLLGFRMLPLAAALGAAAVVASSPTEPIAAAPLGVIEGDAVDVSAEHLQVDVEHETARLDGSVTLRIGALELSCPSVELRYDRSPRVRYARGIGGVTARLRGIEATAQSIEFDASTRTVDLKGSVRLTRGKGWITAGHAAIDVASGKVTLDDVKGSIPVDPAKR